MNNLSLTPSLDSFLKVHGLVMASFDGKSVATVEAVVLASQRAPGSRESSPAPRER